MRRPGCGAGYNPYVSMLVLLCRYSAKAQLDRALEERSRAGGDGRGVRGSGSCSNRLCQPPAVVSSFILALRGRTEEREGSRRGGVGRRCAPDAAHKSTAATRTRLCRNQHRWHGRK